MSTPGFKVEMGGGEDLEVSGWDAIEGLAADAGNKEFKEAVDHAGMYRQCFSTVAGRYVLADFMHAFLMCDIVGENDAPGSLIPGVRQGRASLVKHILYMIDFANSGGGRPTGSGVISGE